MNEQQSQPQWTYDRFNDLASLCKFLDLLGDVADTAKVFCDLDFVVIYKFVPNLRDAPK